MLEELCNNTDCDSFTSTLAINYFSFYSPDACDNSAPCNWERVSGAPCIIWPPDDIRVCIPEPLLPPTVIYPVLWEPVMVGVREPSDALEISIGCWCWLDWLTFIGTGVPGRLECFCITALTAISSSTDCQLAEAMVDLVSGEASQD